MGILAANIRFTGPIPTESDVVVALCRHTGEAVNYEEETCALTCPTTGYGILAVADQEECLWVLRTGVMQGNYLWYATLLVLQEMGGVQLDFDGTGMPAMPAPAWAYKPWQRAKKAYRWRKWRKASWLTPDEAHRLGVE